MELPNKPERRGRRGSFKFKFKTQTPKKPVKIRTTAAENFFFSEKIIKKHTKIKINGINFLMIG